MRILIAEDDPTSNRVLEAMLRKWGHDVVVTRDGGEAWTTLQRKDAPHLLILDWMMPEMDGLELCRRIRGDADATPPHIILLTAKGRKEDIVAGLQAGADDYITKPFDPAEMQARVQVGERVLTLQGALAERVAELQEALGRVKQLSGLLPICSYCKKVRDDRNYWQQVESYVTDHSEARFSHGICPDCYQTIVVPTLEGMGGGEGHGTRGGAR